MGLLRTVLTARAAARSARSAPTGWPARSAPGTRRSPRCSSTSPSRCPYNALADGRWGVARPLRRRAHARSALLARASRLAPFGPVEGPAWAAPAAAHHRASSCWPSACSPRWWPWSCPSSSRSSPAMAVALDARARSLAYRAPGHHRGCSASRSAASALAVAAPPAVEHRLPPARHHRCPPFTGVEAPGRGADLADLLRFQVGPLGGAPLGWALPRRRRPAAAHRPGRAPRVGGAGLDAGRRVVGRSPGLSQRGDLPVHAAAARGAARPGRGRPRAGHGDGRGRLRGRPARLPLRLAPDRVGRRRPPRSPSPPSRCSAPPSTAAGRCRPATTAGPSRFIDAEHDDAAFRVLWLGDPSRPARSAAGSWPTASPTAPPTAARRASRTSLVGSDDGRTGLLADAVDLARTGQTARLGRLLAPMGVRYVVVPERLAPAPFATERPTRPAGFMATLDAQLDLEPLDVPAGLTRVPQPGVLPRAGRAARRPRRRPTGASPPPPSLDLSRRAGRPPRRGRRTCAGRARWPTTAYVLVVGAALRALAARRRRRGRPTPRSRSAGPSASRWPTAATATLRFRTPPLRYGLARSRRGPGAGCWPCGPRSASGSATPTARGRPTPWRSDW